MKFVVHTKIKHLVPPEVTLKLINAVEPWQKQWGGKIEQTWSFAGIQGGGGILNVESLEELDAVMGSFPLLGVSDVEILPIVELGVALKRSKKVLEASI